MLSQTAVYALRAMACLAILPPDTAVRAKDLSESTGVPPHYLSKIMRRLVLAGLLESRKGHGGGFSLSRSPEKIFFAEILAATDGLPEPNTCAFGWGQCDAENPCPLHPSWSRLLEAFEGWTGTTTLAEAAQSGVDPAALQSPRGARP